MIEAKVLPSGIVAGKRFDQNGNTTMRISWDAAGQVLVLNKYVVGANGIVTSFENFHYDPSMGTVTFTRGTNDDQGYLAASTAWIGRNGIQVSLTSSVFKTGQTLATKVWDAQGRLTYEMDTNNWITFELYPGVSGKSKDITYNYGPDGSKTVLYDNEALLDTQISANGYVDTGLDTLGQGFGSGSRRRSFVGESEANFYQKYDSAGRLIEIGINQYPLGNGQVGDQVWTLANDRVTIPLGGGATAVFHSDGTYRADWPDGSFVSKSPNGREEYYVAGVSRKIWDPSAPVLYTETRFVGGLEIKFRELFAQVQAGGIYGRQYDVYGRAEVTYMTSANPDAPATGFAPFTKTSYNSSTLRMLQDASSQFGTLNVMAVTISPYLRSVHTRYRYVADPNNFSASSGTINHMGAGLLLAVTGATTAEQMAAKASDIIYDYIATGTVNANIVGAQISGSGVVTARKFQTEQILYAGVGADQSILSKKSWVYPVTVLTTNISGQITEKNYIDLPALRNIDCSVSDCSSSTAFTTGGQVVELTFNSRGQLSRRVVRDTAAGTIEVFDSTSGHTRESVDGSWKEFYGTVSLPAFSVPGGPANFGGSGDGYIKKNSAGKITEVKMGNSVYTYSPETGLLLSVKVGSAAPVLIDPSQLKMFSVSDADGAFGYGYDSFGRVTTTYLATGEKVLTTYHFNNASDWAGVYGRRKDAKNTETVLNTDSSPSRTLVYASKTTFIAQEQADMDEAAKAQRENKAYQPRTTHQMEYIKQIVLPDGTIINCNTSDCVEYMLGLKGGWGVEIDLQADLSVPILGLLEAEALGGDHHMFVAGLIGALNTTTTEYRTARRDGNGNIMKDSNGYTIYDYYNPLLEGFMDHTQTATANAIIQAIYDQVDEGRQVINISQDLDWDALSKMSELDRNNLRLRFQAAVDHATDHNVAIVVAAGNHGQAGMGMIAQLEGVITVGSVDFAGRRTDSSSTGPHLDFVAVADNIVSTTATGIGYWSGTSFAAPQLAITIAKMIAYDLMVNGVRTITKKITDIMSILKDTSTDLGAQGHDSSFGWGLFNPFKAIQKMTQLFNR